MCLACFKKYADEPVTGAWVDATTAMLRNCPGDPEVGLLHVIVADMNVDDWFFVLDDPEAPWRKEEYDAAEEWEQQVFSVLAALTEAERATAVARYLGIFP